MIKKLLFTILLGLSAFANTLTVGSTIPTLTIKDQFEKDYIVDANIKTIIFSATKTEGTTIKEFLLTTCAVPPEFFVSLGENSIFIFFLNL